MTVLKILTYNVCWECISGSDKASVSILKNVQKQRK